MVQKIIKVGNSYAVTIPQQIVKTANYKLGDKVNVDTTVSGDILIAKVEQRTNSNISPWLDNWLESTGKKYTPLIKKLSNI